VKLFTTETSSAFTPTLARWGARALSLALAIGLAASPLPTLAAPPEEGAAPEEAPPAEDAAPAEAAPELPPAAVGTGTVAILKFGGDDYKANDFRARVQAALGAQGFTANFIKRSIDEAAQKNKCKTVDAGCLEKIGAYLNKNSSTAYDYFVWATVPADGVASLSIYDVKGKKTVVDLSMISSANDFILSEVIGNAVARKLVDTQVPPAPATEDEQQIIATLDEPKETPEEIAAREEALAAAMKEAGDNFNAGVDVGEQNVDLKKDFDSFCRTGKREDKEVEGDDGEVTKERDLRPACKRGPVFGYWQPRAWVALTLTLGSAATMGAMWGLAAAARSDWSKAKDELEASGLSATDPTNRCNADGVCYEDLAGAVSDATGQIRRRAIVGDVFLGATVLLTGVLAIIIYQDRQAAKGFISREKELRALSNLRVAPVFGRVNGAAVGFEF
jgi:hypothetical protein